MSTKILKLKIVTPERLVFEEDVEQVTIPTMAGEITVLPDHIPLISALKSGDIVAVSKGPASQADSGRELIPFAVSGGFIEVKSTPDKKTEVIILADFAEHVSSITDTEIEKAKARAEELRKAHEKGEIVDFEHFESELERSLTRVKIADKWRAKKYRK